MNKSRTVAFRVTEEQYEKIEKAARASGKIPSDWCRDLSLGKVGAEDVLNENEKMIFEELAKARYLLSIGFGLLASGELNNESWSNTKQIVEEKGKDIVAALLKRRK
jgi:uncharacterized protein (DUF1778 family)